MGNYISKRYEDTVEYGRLIGSSLMGGEMIILTGKLGSGKTVLTKGIAEGLQIDEVITSPSFTIMNLYTGRLELCHFDFYRIEDRSEMLDLIEDYLYREQSVSVVEWGEPLTGILESFIHVHIDISGERRVISMDRRNGDGEVHEERGGNRDTHR